MDVVVVSVTSLGMMRAFVDGCFVHTAEKTSDEVIPCLIEVAYDGESAVGCVAVGTLFFSEEMPADANSGSRLTRGN